MRKVTYCIDDVKNKIKSLQGNRVRMKVNLGRKKVVFQNGVVENVYSSLFTVKLLDEERVISYSYSDVLCGDIRFKLL